MRTDVSFLETRGGVYVQGNGDAFVVQGAEAYRYLSALLPHLDGSTTLRDLVAALPEAHAATVRSLITALASRGIITDALKRSTVLDAPTLSRFGGQVALLEHHGDDGSGFARAARARVLVICENSVPATALADALTANGVGSAPSGTVRVRTVGDVSAAATAGSDLICLIAADRPPPALFDLADSARAARTAFVSLLRIGELLVLGPWQHGDRESASVHSMMLRLSDNGMPGTADVWQAVGAGLEAAAPAPELPAAAVSMAVGIAGFEVFATLTGRIAGDTESAVVIIDPDRYTIRTERLIPHPASPGGSREGTATGHPGSADAAPDEHAYRRFQHAIADTVGIVRRFDDDAVAQVPLRTAVLIAPSADPAPVVAFGIEDRLETRLAALEQASLRYAMNIQRRCPGLLERPEPDAEVVTAERMHSWLGAVPLTDDPMVAARSLTGSAPVTLPRGAVLAGPWDRRAARFEPDLAGLAAGGTPAVAVSRALLDAAGAYAVVAVAHEEIPVSPVEDPFEIPRDGTGQLDRLSMLAEVLRQDGCSLWFSLARGIVPVAVVQVADSAGRQVVARPGRSWLEAAESALLAIVGARQIADSPNGWGELCFPVAPVLNGFSVSARLGDFSLLSRTVDDEALIALLHAAGMRAAAVDLTPPDLAGITNVVRVLLYRSAGRGSSSVTGMAAGPRTTRQAQGR